MDRPLFLRGDFCGTQGMLLQHCVRSLHGFLRPREKVGDHMGEKKPQKPIRLKTESLPPPNSVLNGSSKCPTDPFGCSQRFRAAIANGRVRTLKLWKLSSQALVSALRGLVLARSLKDVSKPKLQRSSGASKTLGPSSERDFGVRPSGKRRMSAYVQNYIFDRNSDLPARV